LNVTISFYDIIDWGPSQVVFIDEAPSCVRYTYTISWLAQSVNALRQKKQNASGSVFGSIAKHWRQNFG
jgi:hypothetical protein